MDDRTLDHLIVGMLAAYALLLVVLATRVRGERRRLAAETRRVPPRRGSIGTAVRAPGTGHGAGPATTNPPPATGAGRARTAGPAHLRSEEGGRTDPDRPAEPDTASAGGRDAEPCAETPEHGPDSLAADAAEHDLRDPAGSDDETPAIPDTDSTGVPGPRDPTEPDPSGDVTRPAPVGSTGPAPVAASRPAPSGRARPRLEPADPWTPQRPARPSLAVTTRRPSDPAPTPDPGLVPMLFGPPVSAALAPWQGTPQHPGVPDTTIDGGLVGSFEVRSVSARGFAHRARGVVRQDSVAVGADDARQRLVLAVADGVSAAPLSHLGSRAAVAAAVDLLAAAGELPDDPGVAVELAGAVARRVLADPAARRAVRAGADPADLSTTLSVAVLAPHADGIDLVVLGVGDSPVYLLHRDTGAWERIAPADDDTADRPASTSTAALPLDSPAAWSVRRLVTHRHAVLAMSDGLGNPLGPGGGEVGRYLAGAWADPPDPVAMAVQLQFHRRTFNDDRSVVAAWSTR